MGYGGSEKVRTASNRRSVFQKKSVIVLSQKSSVAFADIDLPQ